MPNGMQKKAARKRLARQQTTASICCLECGEESGGLHTSMYGTVHKYGPTLHTFRPSRQPRAAELTPTGEAK
jgi:hypothetical protein